MGYIVAIKTSKSPLGVFGPDAPEQPDSGVATLWIDDNNWNVRSGGREFRSTFGCLCGNVKCGLLDVDYLYLFDQNNLPFMGLRFFKVDNQAKLKGRVDCDINPKYQPGWKEWILGSSIQPYLSYSFYWRKIDPSEMTPRERLEEMWYIAVKEFLIPEVGAQLSGLVGAENLGITGGIFAVFVVATATGLATLLALIKVILSVFDVATNYAILKPNYDMVVHQMYNATNSNGLRNGAQALAAMLATFISNQAASHIIGKATNKVSEALPMGEMHERYVAMHDSAQSKVHAAQNTIQARAARLRDGLLRKSPDQLKAEANARLPEVNEELEAAANGTLAKKEPGVVINEKDFALAEKNGRVLKNIQKIADRFGITAEHAKRFAVLAEKNGWTLILRASKRASTGLHRFGDQVIGKSLFIKWKIDPEWGCIRWEPGLDIAKDIYGDYMLHQLEAINKSENPHGDPASWAVSPEQMNAAVKANHFEWLQVGKSKILTHNGKIVIGDVDAMGFYIKMKDGNMIPVPSWLVYNDSAHLQAYMDKALGGVKITSHGHQDVSGGMGGKPLRSPDFDEKYIVFEPGMKVCELNTTAEAQIYYERVRIFWPYADFTAAFFSLKLQGLGGYATKGYRETPSNPDDTKTQHKPKPIVHQPQVFRPSSDNPVGYPTARKKT